MADDTKDVVEESPQSEEAPTEEDLEEAHKDETPKEGEADAKDEVPSQPDSEAAEETPAVEEPDKTAAPKWENEKKSMAGRISKLQTEVNESQRAVEMVKALNEAALRDPKFKEVANKKLVEYGGASPSDVPVKETPMDTDVSQHPAVQWAMQKRTEEQAKNRAFFQEFEGKRPHLSEGTQQEVDRKRRAITSVAMMHMEKGMSQKEAYEKADTELFQSDKIRKEGELSGIAKAQSASSTIGAGSGKSATTSAKKELTPGQSKVAKAFGMSSDEYSDWDENSTDKFKGII